MARKSNILIAIAKECPDAYCVSPETIQEAINRGISQGDICIAMVEIYAGMADDPKFYHEDRSLCAFVATQYEKDLTST